jgi:hypothetical protein
MITLSKTDRSTSRWSPLEAGVIRLPSAARRVEVCDGAGRVYLDVVPRRNQARFRARGSAGVHRVSAMGSDGRSIATASFRLCPATSLACDRGVYARYARRVWNNLASSAEAGVGGSVVEGRLHRWCVCWLRDHTYTLKAQRHFWSDVTSGTDLFLSRQRPDGMIWDDIHPNRSGAPSWFGEALGKGYSEYLDDGRWVLRRIPVEADVEYIAVEAVHHGWKAGGDDAWMAAQLPALERAIAYTTGSPLRWSRRHGLVKRAYTMDSWDFKHPDPAIGGGGDHRCLAAKGQPFFLFHGDNSGLYAAHWRLAEMYGSLGRTTDASRHQRAAEALRARANALLWKDPIYAHMVPERQMPGLKAKVGDDDQRISLSLPYTINRGLPEHGMAVRIIDEYRRRRQAKRRESFAEWWAMDPLYSGTQWGDGNPAHQSLGEYMNGGISPLVAGELARAAFEHGREDYGSDILRRLWDLSEADGGSIHDTYRQIPSLKQPKAAPQRQRPLDLRRHANVGLRNGASPGVTAWTGEGDNDMRNLPTGRQRWLDVAISVIAPARNAGRSTIALGGGQPSSITVPCDATIGCLYAAHALAGGAVGTAGRYVLVYADGTEHAFPLIAGRELANWWNPQPLGGERASANTGRICWRGPNPVATDVGLYLSGFTNPRPDVVVSAIRLEAAAGVRLMVAALTVGDGPARFALGIRSFGLPDVWSQGAIHHALVEGLAGIEDTDRAFAAARISPRWAATEVRQASACVHYPASDGYCAYEMRLDRRARRLVVDVTGTFRQATLRILLPAGMRPRGATCGDVRLPMRIEQVERSRYAVIGLDALPGASITLA